MGSVTDLVERVGSTVQRYGMLQLGQMAAPDAGLVLQRGEAVRVRERTVRDEDPIIGEARTAAVGPVPDSDGGEGEGTAEIDLPPRVRFRPGGDGDGVIGYGAIGIAIGGERGGEVHLNRRSHCSTGKSTYGLDDGNWEQPWPGGGVNPGAHPVLKKSTKVPGCWLAGTMKLIC